jgi:hypothetical protein
MSCCLLHERFPYRLLASKTGEECYREDREGLSFMVPACVYRDVVADTIQIVRSYLLGVQILSLMTWYLECDRDCWLFI